MEGLDYKKKDQKKIKETILFIISSKRIKFIVINLPKKAKGLHSENCKILMKEIKGDTMERYTMSLDQNNQCYENDCITQSNLQIQCNPQLPMAFFIELEQNNLQFV